MRQSRSQPLRAAALVALLALAGCATAPPPAPVAAPLRTPPPPAAPPAAAGAGLDRVMGQNAHMLEELFGTPNQDVREQGARKLQFASSACVLDAYLYAKAAGREPVVTWIDARLPSGDDIDRASCIAALSRRREAR